MVVVVEMVVEMVVAVAVVLVLVLAVVVVLVLVLVLVLVVVVVLIEYNARMGDPETQALVLLWPEEKHILRAALSLDFDCGNLSQPEVLS